jgi:hypothetical protein
MGRGLILQDLVIWLLLAACHVQKVLDLNAKEFLPVPGYLDAYLSLQRCHPVNK